VFVGIFSLVGLIIKVSLIEGGDKIAYSKSELSCVYSFVGLWMAQFTKVKYIYIFNVLIRKNRCLAFLFAYQSV
jgi:hypothetical protein